MTLFELVGLVGEPFDVGVDRVQSDEPKRCLVRKALGFGDHAVFKDNIRRLELPYWAHTIGMGIGCWKEKSGWKAVYLQVREARYEHEIDMRQWLFLYTIDASRARRLGDGITAFGGAGVMPPASDQDSCVSQAGKMAACPIVAELKIKRGSETDWGTEGVRVRRYKDGLRFEGGRNHAERHGGRNTIVMRWTRESAVVGVRRLQDRHPSREYVWTIEPTPELAKELLTMRTVAAIV